MKTAICAIIKDEHLFLKEWIDWHLGLGFDAIHLFEDKGSKSHEEIVKEYNNVFLRRYEDDEEVQELLAWQGNSNRQKTLYEYFSDTYKGTYDWVAFIDLDEFVMLEKGYSLSKLCEEFEPYPCVLLNWKMIGASGHIKRPKGRVMEAYTEESSFLHQDKMWEHKSFVNLVRYKGMATLHRAIDAVNTHHEDIFTNLYYDKAWLNHYFTKSWEDWVDRIFVRGGTMHAHRTLGQFFDANKSMEHLRDELIASVAERIPNGTYWLDRKRGLIAGGNVKKIMELNKKCNEYSNPR